MNLLNKIFNSDSSKVIPVICFLAGQLFTTSFCADKSNSDTLALVGKKAITSEDFITSYKDKLTRIGLTDNGGTRISYLINLVSSELFIVEVIKS
jgi:hypothetical protein